MTPSPSDVRAPAAGVEGEPPRIETLVDELRAAAQTVIRLAAAIEARVERTPPPAAVAARNGDTLHLVGRPQPPRRLVGPLAVHGFRVDPGRHTVTLGMRHALLTPNEWQLFALLLAEPGRTFSRDELAVGAWGRGYGGRDSEVEVYISRLRRKLEADPRSPLLIETVRGSGYRLMPPEEPAPDGALEDPSEDGDGLALPAGAGDTTAIGLGLEG